MSETWLFKVSSCGIWSISDKLELEGLPEATALLSNGKGAACLEKTMKKSSLSLSVVVRRGSLETPKSTNPKNFCLLSL